MDYLKEFQAFAGRFSAAAEDKLAEVDGGTYNEFFRFYSRRWPSEVSLLTAVYVHIRHDQQSAMASLPRRVPA